MSAETKKCTRCGLIKPHGDFRRVPKKNRPRPFYLTSKCIPCEKEYLAELADKNREKRREASFRWLENNRAKRQTRSRQLYAENREKKLRRIRKTRRESQSATESAARRRATLRGATIGAGELKPTPLAWFALCAEHDNRCFYCQRQGVRLTRDHVIPLSKGGSHSMDNIVPACQPCNSSKNNKTSPSLALVESLKRT